MNPYLETFGLYGGGAVEHVERHGGSGGAPPCPQDSEDLMDELLVARMPPRSNISLLGSGRSTSMPRGEDTEGLREEPSEVASDLDERVLLFPVMKLFPFFNTLAVQIHKQTHLRFLASGRTRIWKRRAKYELW